MSPTCERSESLITGITVTYNTKALFERAYTSVRKFHPRMKMIVVDNSKAMNPCRHYIQQLQDPNLLKILCGINVGHGVGMNMALRKVPTPYALIFDSDIEMKKSPVADMLAMFREDTYGVGWLEKTALDGYEWGAKQQHKGTPWMRYLHPYFQLISVKRYREFHPYVHHGAPCYLAMRDIHLKGLGEKILIEFPGLGHTAHKGWTWTGNPNLEYIRHDTRGTRDVRVKNREPEIEPRWVVK